MRENTDQNNSEYEHFLLSDSFNEEVYKIVTIESNVMNIK